MWGWAVILVIKCKHALVIKCTKDTEPVWAVSKVSQASEDTTGKILHQVMSYNYLQRLK